MLNEIALVLAICLVLGCSTGQKKTAHAKPDPVPPIVTETLEEQTDLIPDIVVAPERAVVNIAVENWSQPTYPVEARMKKVQGVVVVRVNIEQDGRVSSAKAESGHPLLISAAEEWAKGRRIVPYLVGGKAVSSSGILAVKFGK